MAKRTVWRQVFIVSWFPVGTAEAMTLTCLTRDHAGRIAADLRRDFARYPAHDPVIHIDRTEERAAA